MGTRSMAAAFTPPPQLTVEQARECATLVLAAAKENEEKIATAKAAAAEQTGGDPAKFAMVLPTVYTPVVIECVGDVMVKFGFTKDQGGVMGLAMAMMMHGGDPEVAAAQAEL